MVAAYRRRGPRTEDRSQHLPRRLDETWSLPLTERLHWFVRPIILERVGDYTASAWVITLGAYVAINGFLGPIVEEIYFRGYLLPRMEVLGRLAPLVNVTLFSLYHLWSPWQFVTRIMGFGPTFYAVSRTRNVYLGMIVHCGLNTLGVLLLSSQIISRL